MQQFFGVLETLPDIAQVVNDGFELGALLAECLGAFGVIPDFRVLEFAQNLGQTFLFFLEVKDTP